MCQAGCQRFQPIRTQSGCFGDTQVLRVCFFLIEYHLILIVLTRLDESSYEDLRELALDLMTSSSSIPIGSAVYAFNKIHPEVENLNDSMFSLHPVFRHLVRQLVECEEWSQLVIIDLLARYSRLFLPKPESDESIDKDLDDFLRICQYLLGSQNIAVSWKFFSVNPLTITRSPLKHLKLFCCWALPPTRRKRFVVFSVRGKIHLKWQCMSCSR